MEPLKPWSEPGGGSRPGQGRITARYRTARSARRVMGSFATAADWIGRRAACRAACPGPERATASAGRPAASGAWSGPWLMGDRVNCSLLGGARRAAPLTARSGGRQNVGACKSTFHLCGPAELRGACRRALLSACGSTPGCILACFPGWRVPASAGCSACLLRLPALGSPWCA